MKVLYKNSKGESRYCDYKYNSGFYSNNEYYHPEARYKKLYVLLYLIINKTAHLAYKALFFIFHARIK